MSKPFTVEQLRCLELARIIREGLPEVRFDMSNYRNRCGTAGCIGGHAIAFYVSNLWQTTSVPVLELEDAAIMLLGVHGPQAMQLFAPWYCGGPNPSDITPAMAAATLENFALTGKVEWPKP